MRERIGLPDAGWGIVGALSPVERGRGCRPAQDNRRYFEGMMWIARTGAQWRRLPDEYGKWNSVFRRYRRWTTTGVFDAMLETPAEVVERDGSADMIDSAVIRAHHCAVGMRKELDTAEALGRSRGGFTTKLQARCDVQGRPLALMLTFGQTHDLPGFRPLMRIVADRIDALLAGKGYDADAIREEMADAKVEAVIPAKANRRDYVPHDPAKYRWRNRIGRLFNNLKRWRPVATRYDKTAASHIGFVSFV